MKKFLAIKYKCTKPNKSEVINSNKIGLMLILYINIWIYENS